MTAIKVTRNGVRLEDLRTLLHSGQAVQASEALVFVDRIEEILTHNWNSDTDKLRATERKYEDWLSNFRMENRTLRAQARVLVEHLSDAWWMRAAQSMEILTNILHSPDPDETHTNKGRPF